MERAQKAEAIETLKAQFSKMTSAVFLDFTGMTVGEVSKLRDVFRAKGVEYKVVKNKLVQKALADHSWAPGLNSALRGMTGVAWSYEEPSAAARAVSTSRSVYGSWPNTWCAYLVAKERPLAARVTVIPRSNTPEQTRTKAIRSPAIRGDVRTQPAGTW